MSSIQPMTPPTSTFPLFPNLPPELRLKIWQCTLQPRRLVWDMENDWPSSATGPLSHSCPAINSCDEARRLLSPQYTFCTDAAPAPIPGHGAWVNFDLDTVCLLHGMSQLELLLETQNPILDGLRWLELTPSDECNLDLLNRVRGLQKLEVVSVIVRDVESGEEEEERGEDFLVEENDDQVASQSNIFPSWANSLSFTLGNMSRALDIGSARAPNQGRPALVAMLAPGSGVSRFEGALWDLIEWEDGLVTAEVDEGLMACVMARFSMADGDGVTNGNQEGGWMARRILGTGDADADADFFVDLIDGEDDADGSELEFASQQSEYESWDI